MDERFQQILRQYKIDPVNWYPQLVAEARRRGISDYEINQMLHVFPFIEKHCLLRNDEAVSNYVLGEDDPHRHWDPNVRWDPNNPNYCPGQIGIRKKSTERLKSDIIEKLFQARQDISTPETELQITPEERRLLILQEFDELMDASGPGYMYHREAVHQIIEESLVAVMDVLSEMLYVSREFKSRGIYWRAMRAGRLRELLHSLRMLDPIERHMSDDPALDTWLNYMVEADANWVSLIPVRVSPPYLMGTSRLVPSYRVPGQWDLASGSLAITVENYNYRSNDGAQYGDLRFSILG